jgi:hypothetical protein
MAYTYDVEGRRKTTRRIGSDASEVPIESIVYDSAGRMQSKTEFGSRQTLY